jgi:hypothetical protein
MNTSFNQLNEGWNAEPNAPSPSIEVQGEDVVLEFHDFEEEEVGILRFVRCERYRLGPFNDEGWYSGQCRFSKTAPKWGEFYAVHGDPALLDVPEDWRPIRQHSDSMRHFLFYFRDQTFECVAEQCVIELSIDNSLQRTSKVLPRLPE